MKSFSKIDGEQVSSVHEFLNNMEEIRDNNKDTGKTWYFRGVEESTQLLPSSALPPNYAGKKLNVDPDIEKKILKRFKRFAYPYIGSIQNDWEALFLARHYGLPTRILDWSSNPLVSLYFACSYTNEFERAGALWGIIRTVNEEFDIDVLNKDSNPFSLFPDDEYEGLPAIKLILPVYNSSRIAAQKGVFTWHSYPFTAIEQLAGTQFEEKLLDISLLCKWSIPFKNKRKLLLELERLGINQRSIFPDLEGIAKGIWQSMVLCDDKSVDISS